MIDNNKTVKDLVTVNVVSDNVTMKPNVDYKFLEIWNFSSVYLLGLSPNWDFSLIRFIESQKDKNR